MNNLILYVITVLIWGTTWFAIKLQLVGPAAEVSIFYRFVIATIIMLLICKIKKIKLCWRISDQLTLIGLGFFLFSTNYIFMYGSTKFLVSGLVSVVFSMASILNIINKTIFLKQKPKARVVFGAALGIVGICSVFAQEALQLELHADTFRGLFCGLIAAYCFSIGNIISSKTKTHILSSTTISMFYGTLIMLIYISILKIPFSFSMTTGYISSLLYLGILGTAIVFICYLQLIKQIGPEKAGYATVVFPIIALLISTVLEGYRWTYTDTIGLVLILIGNCFVLTGKRSHVRFIE